MYNDADIQRMLASQNAQVLARGPVVSRVMGLLGFGFVFTGVGAAVTFAVGPQVMGPGAILSLITLLLLMFVREKSPLNLGVLYAFTFFEGLLLGGILSAYVASGAGGTVVAAAATTAAVTLGAGGYGMLTKRDLSGMGAILFPALIGVVVASLISVIFQLSVLSLAISAVVAVLFTAYIAFDMNRLARKGQATEGEAIMLAVAIYLDIINLFLALLRILRVVSR